MFQNLLKDDDKLKTWPALIEPLPALITLLLVKWFPKKLAPNLPNNILRNPPFCSFASSLIVLLTPFF